MAQPEAFGEIFLEPGDFFFGEAMTRIRTVLGSCIAITMWHPTRRIGGMCHYMLPTRGGPKSINDRLDGKYADEAVELFMRACKKYRSHLGEFEIKVMGGANMFPGQEMRPADAPAGVGARNVEYATNLIQQYGGKVFKQHVGDTGHRRIIFDIWSGEVKLHHQRIESAVAAKARPKR